MLNLSYRYLEVNKIRYIVYIFLVLILIKVINIIINIMLFKKIYKNNSNKLLIIGNEVLYYILDIVNNLNRKLNTVLKIIAFLLLSLFVLENFHVLKYINKYILINEKISTMIYGAFLASFLGIVTQLFMRKINVNNDIKKHSSILYCDLKNIISSCSLVLDEYCIKENFLGNVYEELNFNSNWRENYSFLSNELDNKYYEKISSIYYSANKINEAIRIKNIGAFRKEVLKINNNNYSKYISGPVLILNVTNEEILQALEKLSKGKKIRLNNFKRLLLEIRYQKIKKEWFSKLEKYIVNILSLYNELDFNVILQYIKKTLTYVKLNKKDKKLLQGINKVIPITNRITFEIIMESKKMDMIWNKCKLK